MNVKTFFQDNCTTVFFLSMNCCGVFCMECHIPVLQMVFDFFISLLNTVLRKSGVITWYTVASKLTIFTDMDNLNPSMDKKVNAQ